MERMDARDGRLIGRRGRCRQTTLSQPAVLRVSVCNTAAAAPAALAVALEYVSSVVSSNGVSSLRLRENKLASHFESRVYWIPKAVL